MTKPSPIALVICDAVYTEAGGKKTSLVGLFNRITAEKFPARHPRLWVYASATGIRPNSFFKLEIVHSETEHEVVSVGGAPPKETTPISVCDFNFQLPELVFPEPGIYYVRFWGNDHLLLQRPFHVTLPGSEEVSGGSPE